MNRGIKAKRMRKKEKERLPHNCVSGLKKEKEEDSHEEVKKCAMCVPRESWRFSPKKKISAGRYDEGEEDPFCERKK